MISCEIGTGTSFVNQHGSTGLVVPPEDSQALAQAMLTLHQAPDLRTQFAAAARQRYQAVFSGDALGKAHSALYRAALYQTHSAAAR
jgi:rhamnosyl/mannosyltransferase